MERYILCSRTGKFNIAQNVHSLLAGFLFIWRNFEGKHRWFRNLYGNTKNLRAVKTIKNKNKKTQVAKFRYPILRQSGTCINIRHTDQWKKAESRNGLNKNGIYKEENEHQPFASHHMQILNQNAS